MYLISIWIFFKQSVGVIILFRKKLDVYIYLVHSSTKGCKFNRHLISNTKFRIFGKNKLYWLIGVETPMKKPFITFCPVPRLKEFNVKSKKERIRRYRRFVYEAGALDKSDRMQTGVIDAKVIAKERKKDFEISRTSRFRYRTR